MVNFSRRGVLGLIGGTLVTASATSAFAQSATSDTLAEEPSAQVQVALDYLSANQQGQSQLILDKVNSTLYLVNGGGGYDSISVYHGKKKADDLANDGSGQVTPAGKGGVEFFFDPNLSEQYLRGITLDFLKGINTKLSLHSELGTENDSTPSKTSEGCVRLPRDKFDYVVNFVMNAEHAANSSYLATSAQKVKEARTAGRALDEPIKTAVDIYILPELDVSRENTLRLMQKPLGCSIGEFEKGAQYCLSPL